MEARCDRTKKHSNVSLLSIGHALCYEVLQLCCSMNGVTFVWDNFTRTARWLSIKLLSTITWSWTIRSGNGYIEIKSLSWTGQVRCGLLIFGTIQQSLCNAAYKTKANTWRFLSLISLLYAWKHYNRSVVFPNRLHFELHTTALCVKKHKASRMPLWNDLLIVRLFNGAVSAAEFIELV
jgi:hypothetical protein